MEKTKMSAQWPESDNGELPPLPCACSAQCDPRERHRRSKHEQSDFDRWMNRMKRQVARCSALAQFEKVARAHQYANQLVARCQPLRTGERDWKTSEENCQRRGPALQLKQADIEEFDSNVEAQMTRIKKDLQALDLCTQRSIDAVRELATMEDYLEE